jgi:hypothetical protein
MYYESIRKGLTQQEFERLNNEVVKKLDPKVTRTQFATGSERQPSYESLVLDWASQGFRTNESVQIYLKPQAAKELEYFHISLEDTRPDEDLEIQEPEEIPM